MIVTSTKASLIRVLSLLLMSRLHIVLKLRPISAYPSNMYIATLPIYRMTCRGDLPAH